MSSVIKKGDLGAVDEVLGWDPRGDDEEYDMLEKAQEAFFRIKKELSSQKKSLKEEKQKYDELFRMTESYIKRLHTAEEEKKRLCEALERISIGMDVRHASAAQVEGYFRGFAEATLKKGG
jgi:cob(I)alamin adenosyltransferase